MNAQAIFDYSTGFMVACSYLAMCVGYYHRNKFKELKWMFLYPLASFLQVCFGLFIDRNTGKFITFGEGDKIIGYSNQVFLITELLIIYNFFIHVLGSNRIKKSLCLLGFVFTVIILVNSLFFSDAFYDLFAIQSLFILTPCYFHFRALFNASLLPDLRNSPIFWVIVGITLFFACTFPLYILTDSLTKENAVIVSLPYSINFIFYGILFLMIMRAYLFKIKATN